MWILRLLDEFASGCNSCYNIKPFLFLVVSRKIDPSSLKDENTFGCFEFRLASYFYRIQASTHCQIL